MSPAQHDPAAPARLLLLPGEPAGVGPELALQLAQHPRSAELVALADLDQLRTLAGQLGIAIALEPWSGGPIARESGRLSVLHEPLQRPARPGQLDPANAAQVLRCIDRGVAYCLSGDFEGLVTGPVHKGVLNDAGVAFSGMTERLAALCGGADVVMMLASPKLRVALVTTHLPLRAVADAITADAVATAARTLVTGLRRDFGIPRPRVGVLGLNPHAGEDGHLGREEIEVISPCLDRLRADGLDLVGPLPADTAFLPQLLPGLDAILAMYHDQGLPVLKYSGFEQAVNISLGLPLVRVAVDHGTALALAGSGRADASSLQAALSTAEGMALNRRQR